MTVALFALGEPSIAQPTNSATKAKQPPPKRTTIAKYDLKLVPEAR